VLADKPYIRGLLAGLVLAGFIFIAYHAIGIHKAVWINREAIIQLDKQFNALRQEAASPTE